MREFTYERFIKHNPDAKLIARKKIHPQMKGTDMMAIYAYRHDEKTAYLFRYQERMITNPIFLPVPIPDEELPLFCYEWFQEWITLSQINEIFDSDEEFYSSPSHMNLWDFEKKWTTRYGIFYGMNEGEELRKKRKNDVFNQLLLLQQHASNGEKEEIKKKLEEWMDAL